MTQIRGTEEGQGEPDRPCWPLKSLDFIAGKWSAASCWTGRGGGVQVAFLFRIWRGRGWTLQPAGHWLSRQEGGGGGWETREGARPGP